METDWEFEVGGESALIDALWSGFVDLRKAPERAIELPEARQFPPMARALALLNAPSSPMWTAKCDFFPSLAPGEFDPDELDAPDKSTAACGAGCYIDLLPSGPGEWAQPEAADGFCRLICAELRAIQLRSCRIDLIVRRALLAPNHMLLGITAYLAACGTSPAQAAAALGGALVAFAETVSAAAADTQPALKLQ